MPGKFNSRMDEAVYLASLDGGPDSEVGSVHENGAWFGLMRGPNYYYDQSWPRGIKLSRKEQHELEGYAGAIIIENDQGFVDVEYYQSESELDEAWAEIEEQFYEDE